MYLNITDIIRLNNTYKIVPLDQVPEEFGICGTLVFINDYFKSGKVLIFDNTQSFVITNDGIFRFYFEENGERIERNVQYVLYVWENYVLK